MIEIFVTMGLFFLAVGTIGLIRFPDTLNRMHATSKASTLGVAFTIGAGAVKFYPSGAYLSALLAVFFMFMTAPTGAHMIARSTYRQDIRGMDVVRSVEGANEEWRHKEEGEVAKKDRAKPLKEFLKS